MKKLMTIIGSAALLFSTGCIDEWFDGDEGSENQLDVVDVFLHADVTDWEESIELYGVYFNGNQIILDHDESFRDWDTITRSVSVNANAWIIVDQGDSTIAATWEWLRPGQKVKNKSSVNGDHIKKAPLNNFVPKAGETYGFFVSGLARDSARNRLERSNVIYKTWE